MITRTCVRALVEATDGRVLLMRIVEPESEKAFWITPGGGHENDENDVQALSRELREETGLTSFEPGPHIWTRDFTFEWSGETYRQLESFYWLSVDHFDALPTQLEGTIEARSFAELRWWSVDEIAASQERFAPLDLADQIQHLRKHGAPEAPTVLGT